MNTSTSRAQRIANRYAWYNWPRTPKRSSLSPLYLVLWRLPWMIPLLIGKVLVFIGAFGAYGFRDAVSAWRDI